MKPLPLIVMAAYILLYVLAGCIFGGMAVVGILSVEFTIATIIFILVLVEEKPFKTAIDVENLAGYAILAYGVVFFFVPLTVLNILEGRYGSR